MQKLVTSKQIRDFEESIIKESKVSNYSLTLMEKAGSGLADAAVFYKEPYLIVCGKGNNGGDGLVTARYLEQMGKKVYLFLASEESNLTNEARSNLNKAKEKIKCSVIKDINDKDFLFALNSSNTIIECLLGTGVTGGLSPLYKWIVKSINNSAKDVIACDLPIGVNPDTGSVLEDALKAKETVTLGYPKIGLFLYPGKEYAGKVRVIDIGLSKINTNLFLLDDAFVKENMPKRKEISHKGDFGRTLLISGSNQYPGAAILASNAAASMGSGLTSLATKQEVFIQITNAIPEVIHVNFSFESIMEEAKKSTSVVIGPGLTTDNEVKELVENLIKNIDLPMVLDADGINIVSGNKEIIKLKKNEMIITPHPKEFSRLLNVSMDDVMSNKLELAKKTACELGCTVVLKGPGTIIATKDEKIYISPFANSALAKGGTGDVLSGLIGGLISQKLEPSIAACLGVYIHAKTAELIAKDKTAFSLLPQDLITYLPNTIKLYI